MKDDVKRVIAQDLAEHLDQRLTILAHDFMDRCATVDIDYDVATVLAFTVIGHYAACAGMELHATEDEFLATCRQHYRRMRSGFDRKRMAR